VSTECPLVPGIRRPKAAPLPLLYFTHLDFQRTTTTKLGLPTPGAAPFTFGAHTRACLQLRAILACGAWLGIDPHERSVAWGWHDRESLGVLSVRLITRRVSQLLRSRGWYSEKKRFFSFSSWTTVSSGFRCAPAAVAGLHSHALAALPVLWDLFAASVLLTCFVIYPTSVFVFINRGRFFTEVCDPSPAGHFRLLGQACRPPRSLAIRCRSGPVRFRGLSTRSGSSVF